MKIIVAIIYAMFLMVAWIAATSTIVNGSHNATAFKIKSLFYWVTVITSILVGHYLI